MHKNYFEGVLQLRNHNKEVKAFINNQIKKNKIYLAKVEPQPNGLDYYLSDRRFIRRLGKKLKESFPGELKESARLFSQDKQTMKDVYRISVMFRLLPNRVGDKIIHRGEEYKITSIGTKINAKHLKTGKTHMFTSEDLAEKG